MPRPRRALTALLVLGLLALGAVLFSLAVGSVEVGMSDLWHALRGDSVTGDTRAGIVRELRWPRTLTAFAAGGLLALAGALMQVLLRNPLADPYVLGISGGAAAGALFALLLGYTFRLVAPFAFAGAMLSMLIVFALAHGEGRWTQTRLLLTGVIVASGWGALITLLLTLAPEGQLRGMLFWLIGDLSAASSYAGAGLALGCALLVMLPCARDLNQLARGDTVAASLGVNVPRLRWMIYGVASLATAFAVTAGGAIGFVGFVVPHAVRLTLGNDQRVLLPAATIAGGAFLVFADTLSRSIAAPLQLPVGVITSGIGVPLFLFLLARKSRA